MSNRRFLIIKAIIWVEMIMIVAMVVSGSIFFIALLDRYPFLAFIAGPVADFFASLLFLTFLVSLVAGLFYRVFRLLSRTKVPLDLALQERVLRVGTDVSSKMGLKRPVRFLVPRGLFGAGAIRGTKVFVGETLVQNSTTLELEGVMGHELAHILAKHDLVKFVATGLTVVVVFVAFYYTEPLKLWQIAIITVISFRTLVMLPIYWKFEYNADAKAAQLLGREALIQALEKLRQWSFDGISFTHPPLSRRLGRIKRLFP